MHLDFRRKAYILSGGEQQRVPFERMRPPTVLPYSNATAPPNH